MTAAGRRRRVAGVAASVVAASAGYVAAMAPIGRRPRRAPLIPATDADAPTFTVATGNGLYENTTPQRWAAAMLALDADVVAVQELAAPVHAGLRANGVDDHYPYRAVYERPLSSGAGLWSRHPLGNVRTVALGNGDVANIGVVAVIDVGDHMVTVVNVHLIAPLDRTRSAAWHAGFAALEAVLRKVDGPVVLLGDWNATMAHRSLRRFVAENGLRDSHRERRRGLAVSWPSSASSDLVHRALPTMLLLDRVMVRGPIAVRSVSEHTVAGSDHRAVVATLALTAT